MRCILQGSGKDDLQLYLQTYQPFEQQDMQGNLIGLVLPSTQGRGPGGLGRQQLVQKMQS
jgi:hypothetical protein